LSRNSNSAKIKEWQWGPNLVHLDDLTRNRRVDIGNRFHGLDGSERFLVRRVQKLSMH